MKNKLKFNRYYFVLTILLFWIEILIALFAHDEIIRPYIGDLLVVILIYCFAFLNTPVVTTAIAVLLFAYLVETLQFFNIIGLLGLQHSGIARIIIGTSFEWIDILVYTAGITIVLFIEKLISRNLLSKAEKIVVVL